MHDQGTFAHNGLVHLCTCCPSIMKPFFSASGAKMTNAGPTAINPWLDPESTSLQPSYMDLQHAQAQNRRLTRGS